MESRLHNQQHRRGDARRGSRAFSPPHHQFVPPLPSQQQQIAPAAPSSQYHHHHHHQQQQHAPPLQHRLSSLAAASALEDSSRHFPPLPSRPASGAPIPLDHCDYASILAYRQRVNSHLSPHHSGMVPHLARNQNTVWPQTERPQGFRNTDNRLALDEASRYSRQGPFSRDYRESRDDLRSMSELDSSRRSAALSAKLFLDERRPGRAVFQRAAPYEAPLAEVNRRRGEREEAPYDSVLARGSQRLGERGLRKRGRDEEAETERDRATRHRRLYDPGLAVLPRTPEASLDFPLVRRALSLGRFTRELEDRQDGHAISNQAPSPHDRQDSSYIAPSKSSKKKHSSQRRKTLPSEGRFPSPSQRNLSSNPPLAQRLDESEEKFTGLKDSLETHLQTREPHFCEHGARGNPSSPSPVVPHFFNGENEVGSVGNQRLIRSDHVEVSSRRKKSVAAGVSTGGTSDEEQEIGEWNPKQRTSRFFKSVGKALRVVEATPRSKTVKSRVVRLIGSDAKVCGGSPKSRQSGLEDNHEVALELQTWKSNASCKEVDNSVIMQQDDKSLQQQVGEDTHCHVKIKQEQIALTDLQGELMLTINDDSPQVHSPELPPVSSPVQCQNSADHRSKAPTENSAFPLDSHQFVHQKQQHLNFSETSMPSFRQDELGALHWHASSENPGWSTIGSTLPLSITGIDNQPSSTVVPQMEEELALGERSSLPFLKNILESKDHAEINSSLLNLQVNFDAEESAPFVEKDRRQVKDYLPVISNTSFSFDSQPCKQSMLTLSECNPCPTNTLSHGSGDNQSLCDLNCEDTHSLSHSSLFHTLKQPSPTFTKELANVSGLPVTTMLKLAGGTGAENKKLSPDVEGILANTEGILRNTTKETTAEREVRLFGKSLKASVAKVSHEKAEASTIVGSPFDKIWKPAFSTLEMTSDQQGAMSGLPSKISGATIDAPLDKIAKPAFSIPDLALEQQGATDGSQKKVAEATVYGPFDMAKPALSTSELAFEQQVAVAASPEKVGKATVDAPLDIVTKAAFSTPDKASEQQGPLAGSPNKVAEATFDAPLDIVTKSAFSTPDLACEQQGVMIGSPKKMAEATADAPLDVMESAFSSNLAPEQQAHKVAGEADLPATDSVKDEVCVSEAILRGHGGKLETNLSDRPASYAPSKQLSVATLQPHGRVQSTPARAGAHTWRRSTNSHSFSASQAISKIPKPVVTNHLPQLGNQKVSEVAAYVRKGNSLVRAPVSSAAGVSSSLNTGLPHGPVKDMVGKGFSNLIRAPRSYPGFRNAIKNTKSAFRQVFSARKMSLNETTAGMVNNDKLLVAPLTPDISRDGQGVGSSHLLTKATTVVTSEGQTSSSLCAKTIGADDPRPHSAVSEVNSSVLNSTLQPKPVLPNIQSTSAGPKKSEICSTYYVKSKANQLIASLPPVSSGLTRTVQVTSSHSSATTQDLYYKRKNNQLVRNGTETKSKSLQDKASGGQTHTVWHTTVRKALRKRAYLPPSRVWTLKDGPSSQVKSVIPLLFPWKRPGLGVAVRAGRFKALPKAKKGSLLFLISKKLQWLRKAQPVYSHSAGGFSLHRSGVLGLSGANLKWTKSIEKRSKQASEEATKAVAAVEKRRREEKEAVAVAANAVAKAKAHRRPTRQASPGRERVVTVGLVRYKMDASGRTLHRLPDQWCGASTETSSIKQRVDSAILSTPRRLSFDGTEYVRIGNGHQLVRDPKAASRALANEKVRWSLHTARSRRAKRQQYCLFFTRFGKCNKSEGECPYIHDPEKVAVCTKFLKGTCSGANCLFSHKVIPERMPDCSFFLEGMCTNEECPYRHVSVNPKAPICEGFLKGFCVDGDECNKKHTTVCPTFAATGECSDKSTCKLHHPKRKGKRVSNANLGKIKSKKKRRYFVTGSIGFNEQAGESSRLPQHVEGFDSSTDSGSTDFIGIPEVVIDLDETDDFKRKFASIKEQLPLLQEGLHREADMWIKPVLLLQRPIPA